MKKIISLTIILILVMSVVCGCSNSSNRNDKKPQNNSTIIENQNDTLNRVKLRSAAIGEIVSFGEFQQEIKDNTPKPIEWIVLDIKGDKKLLISRYVLDTIKYCSIEIGSTWKNSNVNIWFNEDFFNSAFDESEKEMITNCSIKSSSSTYLTKDSVFTLSSEEVDYYNNVQDLRICEATPYANYYLNSNSKDAEDDINVYWWCRSEQPLGTFITPELSYVCVNYESQEFGLRPAIWVNLREDSKKSISELCIEGAETFDELLDIVNNNELGSDEYTYTAVPTLTTMIAYGEEDFDKEFPKIQTKTCSEISYLIRQNLHHSKYSLRINDYREISDGQLDYIKYNMHDDSQGWFDDVTSIWSTSGYVKSNESYESEPFEILKYDLNDSDFDTTVGIVEKNGRYYWIYSFLFI